MRSRSSRYVKSNAAERAWTAPATRPKRAPAVQGGRRQIADTSRTCFSSGGVGGSDPQALKLARRAQQGFVVDGRCQREIDASKHAAFPTPVGVRGRYRKRNGGHDRRRDAEHEALVNRMAKEDDIAG